MAPSGDPEAPPPASRLSSRNRSATAGGSGKRPLILYGHHYPPPPPPPKPGPSPLVIVLIVIAGVSVLGAGACVVLGSLFFIGASAESEGPVASAVAPQDTAAPTGAPSSTPAGEGEGEGEQGDDQGSDQGEGAEENAAGDAPPSPTATTTSRATTGTWFCTASGSVRVCGFAGVCNNQMVFGNATGKDRFLANMQAKNACEGMARAKGGAAVCIVQCTVR